MIFLDLDNGLTATHVALSTGMVGSINDPLDGKAVANMIFSAVVLYIVTLLFCGCQAWVHATQRQSIAI